MADKQNLATKDSGFSVRPVYAEGSSRCVFEERGIDLEHVQSISPVYALARNVYRFAIVLDKDSAGLMETGVAAPTKCIHFEYDRKAEALIRQREFCRAWAKAGEFDAQFDA